MRCGPRVKPKQSGADLSADIIESHRAARLDLLTLSIGYDLGILSPRIFTMLVIMAVLTTMMTGPLMVLLQGQKHRIAADLQEPSST